MTKAVGGGKMTAVGERGGSSLQHSLEDPLNG